MIKIKLNLFEGIAACTILPNLGFIFTSIILIFSLISNQVTIVYKGVLISYISCLLLLLLTISICILCNKKSKKEFILCGNKFEFLQKEYFIDQIAYCEYYVCKWYAIPIIFVYKQQVGGLINIKLKTGEKIQFKVFYKDYIKLKNVIHNIIEK